MKNGLFSFLTLAVCMISVNATARGFSFGLGPSYMSGVSDLVRFYEDIYVSDDLDVVYSPIAVSFEGKYESDFGLRLGFAVGPPLIFMGFVSSGSFNDDLSFSELSSNVSIGFSLLPSADVTPYAKVGVSYHLVSGDLVDRSSAGTLTALGIEWSRNSKVSFAFQIAKDDAELSFDDGTALNSYGTVASFFVYF